MSFGWRGADARPTRACYRSGAGGGAPAFERDGPREKDRDSRLETRDWRLETRGALAFRALHSRGAPQRDESCGHRCTWQARRTPRGFQEPGGLDESSRAAPRERRRTRPDRVDVSSESIAPHDHAGRGSRLRARAGWSRSRPVDAGRKCDIRDATRAAGSGAGESGLTSSPFRADGKGGLAPLIPNATRVA